MSFHYPTFLWLLALPIIWGFWQWIRPGHIVVMPFDRGQQGDGRYLRFFTNLAGLFPALMLIVAILMLAGPRKPAPPRDQRVLTNIQFCLDVSSSMNMPFGQNVQRYDAAVQAVRDFCQFRKGDAFGLTIFGSEYIHIVPPTKELSAIVSATRYVRPDNLPPWMGGTMIGNALRGCRDQLVLADEGERLIIVISDGESSDFKNGRDRAVAEELLNNKIRVFGIMVGSEDSGGLQTVATITGGKVFSAGDRGALTEVFGEIDKMQLAKFKQVTTDWVDNYTPLAIVGLVTVILYTLSLLGLRYTPW